MRRSAWGWARVLLGWRGFVARTVAWCSASVVLRPFTGEAVPQRMMRRYFEGVLRQIGIRLEVAGRERLSGCSPCILVVNHNSLLDVPCVGVLLDFDYKWVSKKEIFRIPFVGWHLRACGHLWIDRSRRDNAARLEARFREILRGGASILMFPEGTRSVDGELGPFRRGAFATAVRESVPILPVVLDGTGALMKKGSLELVGGGPKTVRVEVGQPIPPPPFEVGDETSRVTLLRDQTRSAMTEALARLRGPEAVAADPAAAS